MNNQDNNPYKNNNYMQNPGHNTNKENTFKIAAGNSIVQEINENPYQKEIEKKFILTTSDSINPNIEYNPYQKNKNKGTPHGPHGPDQYFIPAQSINQDNSPLINPYNKNNRINNDNENNKKNKSNMNNNKTSKMNFPNYSRDSNY